MLPALDATLLAGRALRLDRAGRAGAGDLRDRQSRLPNEITEERPVRLITACPLRRANKIELAPERGHVEKVIVDVRDKRQPVVRGQDVQGRLNIGVEPHRGKALKVSGYQLLPPR